jgi:hypothetical protein
VIPGRAFRDSSAPPNARWPLPPRLPCDTSFGARSSSRALPLAACRRSATPIGRRYGALCFPRKTRRKGQNTPPPPRVTSPRSYLLPVRPSYHALFSRWPPAPTECADRSDRTAPFRPPLFVSQMLAYMKGAPRHLSTSSPPLSTLVSHRAARLPCSRLRHR